MLLYNPFLEHKKPKGFFTKNLPYANINLKVKQEDLTKEPALVSAIDKAIRDYQAWARAYEASQAGNVKAFFGDLRDLSLTDSTSISDMVADLLRKPKEENKWSALKEQSTLETFDQEISQFQATTQRLQSQTPTVLLQKAADDDKALLIDPQIRLEAIEEKIRQKNLPEGEINWQQLKNKWKR